MKLRLLGSSADPAEVSLTIKGIMIALVPVILLALKGFGFEFAASDIVGFIESIFAVVSAVIVALGLVRKMFMSKS